MFFENPHYEPPAMRRLTDEQIEELTLKLNKEWENHTDGKRFLVCKKCNHVITSADKGIEIAGLRIHVFRNPVGVVYRIGCFSASEGCLVMGDPTSEFTWFPGYRWSYAVCMGCMQHLGWFYQASDSHFYGLILNHLKEEKSVFDLKK
ncbi:MAG: hypothetical protein GY765_31870 [bacterium]|nr:hypothetical protein [bacterium]